MFSNSSNKSVQLFDHLCLAKAAQPKTVHIYLFDREKKKRKKQVAESGGAKTRRQEKRRMNALWTQVFLCAFVSIAHVHSLI